MSYPGIGSANATSILIIRFVTLGIPFHRSDFVFLIGKMRWIIHVPVIQQWLKVCLVKAGGTQQQASHNAHGNSHMSAGGWVFCFCNFVEEGAWTAGLGTGRGTRPLLFSFEWREHYSDLVQGIDTLNLGANFLKIYWKIQLSGTWRQWRERGPQAGTSTPVFLHSSDRENIDRFLKLLSTMYIKCIYEYQKVMVKDYYEEYNMWNI